MPLQTGVFSDLIASERDQLVADRVVAREKRSSLENPQTPLSMPAEWLLDLFNGGRTDSGIRISELTALQCVTFLTCVDLIAGKISSLPFHVQQRVISPVNGRAGHIKAYDHDYYDIVALEPNDEMSAQTFFKAFLIHCLAWGNGYAEIQRDGSNTAIAYWPRNPGKTRPRRMTQRVTLDPVPWRPFPVTLEAGEMCYETTDWVDEHDITDLTANGMQYRRLIPKEDMLHVPGLALDGRIGQQPVWLARNTLGLALAMERFGSKYYANYARPGGILEIPNILKVDRDKTRESWMEAQGGENSGRVAVVPVGTKWTSTSDKPIDAQTVEGRTFIRTEIAAMCHVPNRMVGDSGRASKASTEQENQELLDLTFSPWINGIELEWKRKLFPHPKVGRRPKSPFYIQIDVSGMIRGDAASREKFNASGRQWAYLCANDVRELEGMNPIDEPWAEEFWMPVNMTLSTTPINPNHQDGAGNGDLPADGDKPAIPAKPKTKAPATPSKED